MGGITCKGEVITWLCLAEGEALFENYVNKPKSFDPINPFIKLICGKNYFIAIKEDGSLEAWGNSGEDKCNFINLPSDKSFDQVVTCQFGSLGIKKDGSIKTWGKCSQNLYFNTYNNKKFLSITGLNYFFVGICV
jgi:alpha-tubulin suppressor-like RCC1 family protein